jgi:hypothetical protein
MTGTICAEFSIYKMAFFCNSDGPKRAILHTLTAINTFGSIKQRKVFNTDAFRIGTPETIQGAAHQKYQASGTGSVVDRETLHIEDSPGDLTCQFHENVLQVLAFISGNAGS